MNRLVLNTSSSIFFTKVGLIPHLLKRWTLLTSKEIEKEIKDGEEIGFKDARILMQHINDKMIAIVDTRGTDSIVKEFTIKKADASVIALAQEKDCFLATEDRQIERICLLTETKVTNTALLLYHLWRNKVFHEEQTYLLLEILMRNGYNKEICLKIKEKIG